MGLLADAVLVFHGLFIAWAAAGAIAVWRWPRLIWLHLPALAWAVAAVLLLVNLSAYALIIRRARTTRSA